MKIYKFKCETCDAEVSYQVNGPTSVAIGGARRTKRPSGPVDVRITCPNNHRHTYLLKDANTSQDDA